MLDIDGFKRTNAVQGRVAGDAVLAAFGAYARQAFGSDDFLARIGGDEFAALVAAPDRNHAVEHVERLLEWIRRASGAAEGCEHVPFIVSVGLALPRGSGTVRSQVARAGGAFYAAKRAGRNRVIVTAARSRRPGRGAIAQSADTVEGSGRNRSPSLSAHSTPPNHEPMLGGYRQCAVALIAQWG